MSKTNQESTSINLWKNIDFISGGSYFESSPEQIAKAIMLKHALLNSACLNDIGSSGYLKTAVDEAGNKVNHYDKFYAYMVEKGGKPFFKLNDHNTIFLWDEGMIQLSASSNYFSVNGLSLNEDLAKEMEKYFSSHVSIPEPVGQVYAIVSYSGNLQLSSLGNAGIPLVETNYTPKVMEDYKFIIRDLQSKTPSGRISIFRGAPGSGKSFLIRAMLMEVPDAMFVLVSPEMVVNLAGPQLLPLLLNQRGNSAGPIVLILEDADKCLVSRDKENMGSIQSILNLGDGILGSMLDIRIVATTNAEELHLEPALIRPGRLSRMMEVGHLDFHTAKGVFNRLLPDVKLPAELVDFKTFKMTLAEVYGLARKHGWVAEVRKIEADEDDDNYDD